MQSGDEGARLLREEPLSELARLGDQLGATRVDQPEQGAAVLGAAARLRRATDAVCEDAQVVVVPQAVGQLVQLLLERLQDGRPRRLEELERVAKILRPLPPFVEAGDSRVPVRFAFRGARPRVDAREARAHGAPTALADAPVGHARLHPAGERGSLSDRRPGARRAAYAARLGAKRPADRVQRSWPDLVGEALGD